MKLPVLILYLFVIGATAANASFSFDPFCGYGEMLINNEIDDCKVCSCESYFYIFKGWQCEEYICDEYGNIVGISTTEDTLSSNESADVERSDEEQANDDVSSVSDDVTSDNNDVTPTSSRGYYDVVVPSSTEANNVDTSTNQ